NLALLLQKGDDFTEAESMIRESLAMRRRLFKGDHPSVALDLNNLSLLLRDKGDFAGSLSVGKDAVDMFTRTQGQDFWLTGYARMGRGRTLTTMKRFKEAEKELLEAERVMSAPKGVPAGRHKRCLEAVVQLYEAWNKADPRGGHAASVASWRAKLNAGS
nr:tetratricopeptide repeat protein [Vicinamibacteria bacterium]